MTALFTGFSFDAPRGAFLLLALGVAVTPAIEARAVAVAYNFTGALDSFIVPDGVTQINVKLWGAGGGSGSGSGVITIISGGAGGPGGFASADVPTTPGEVLTILVGEGGQGGDAANLAGGSFGGGGDGTTSGPFGGDGGGRSALSRGSVDLLIAGGGGGGGAEGTMNGGGGGGVNGGNGFFSTSIFTSVQPAGGGSQTAGGEFGNTDALGAPRDGAMFQGGDAPSTSLGAFTGLGGGGGGGWFGGGAGAFGGGGGGSGFFSASDTSGAFFNTGAGVFAPKMSDFDYQPGIGFGGLWSPGFGADPGGDGLVVINHNLPQLDATPTDVAIDFGTLCSGESLTLLEVIDLTNIGGEGTLIQLAGASFSNETQVGLFGLAGGDPNALLTDGDFSEQFDITFDAAGLGPGVYTADLTFFTDFGDVTYHLTAEVKIPEPTTLAAMLILSLIALATVARAWGLPQRAPPPPRVEFRNSSAG